MRLQALLIAALTIGLAGCGGGSGAPTQTGGTGGPGGGGGGGGGGGAGSTSNMISVGDNFFDPAVTTVPVGTTVTWTWNGSGTHNVTFANTSLGASANQASGTFAKQFSAAGSFNYQCTIHGSSMSGTVVVQ